MLNKAAGDEVKSLTQGDGFSESIRGSDQVKFEGKLLHARPKEGLEPGALGLGSNFKDDALMNLPAFKPSRVQPKPEEIDLASLKFPETRKFLEGEMAKVKTFLASPASAAAFSKSSLYLDEEFGPYVYSIVDDIRDPELKVERRMEWRRARFIGKPKNPDIWFAAQPDAPMTLQSRCAHSPTVCSIIELLANRGSLLQLYAGGDLLNGLHKVALFDDQGNRNLLTIDDQLPVVVAQSVAVPAYIAPVLVGEVYFFLPSLVEKALAKLFGGYCLLHKAPPAAVLWSLFGSQVASFRLDGTDREKQVLQRVDEIVDSTEQAAIVVLTKKPASGDTRSSSSTLIATKTSSGPNSVFKVGSSTVQLDNLSQDYSQLTICSGVAGQPKQPASQTATLSESQGGVCFVVGPQTGQASVSLRVASTLSDGCNNSWTHIEVLGSNLNSKLTIVAYAADLGAIDLSGLEPDRYFLLAKVQGYSFVAEFKSQGSLEVKPLDEAELGKIKRALVRRYAYKQEIEALQEVAVLGEVGESSVMFKICNFVQAKGREVRFAGFGNWKNWMLEVNGNNARVPLPRNSHSLTGQEEEYVRLYATNKSALPEKVRLVIN